MSQRLGTPGTLHNSQCTLDYGASSATGSGNNLTLNLALTFNASWTGTKSNYLYVGDRGNHAVGWTQMGTWTVGAAAQPPVNVSVSPSSGSGLGPQTFAFTSSSVNGSGYINWMGMLFNYGIAPGACSFNYAPLSNVIWIVGDDGASYVGSGNLGVAGTIENSQCRLDVGASSIVKTYNSVTVNLALTFKAGLPGPQNTYLYTGDSGNLAANWQQMGTWTTSTVSSVGPALVSATPSTGTGLAQTFS